MKYDVQCWTMTGGEENDPLDMVENKEFNDQDEAMRCAWEWLEEGFAVLMFRR